MAEVLENLNLNGRGSDRETRHVELSLEGAGLTYSPGDAVGIFPQNDSSLVEEILTFVHIICTGKYGDHHSDPKQYGTDPSGKHNKVSG